MKTHKRVYLQNLGKWSDTPLCGAKVVWAGVRKSLATTQFPEHVTCKRCLSKIRPDYLTDEQKRLVGALGA